MSDPELEISWYASRSGPRVRVIWRPGLTEVARAVALYVHDPDDAREAQRSISEMTREEVGRALAYAGSDNPLLLSAAKRKSIEPLPEPAEKRLLGPARNRVRELFPEIQQLELAAKTQHVQRPGVEAVLQAAYEGSGGGRPRVPQDYPLMLQDVTEGLLALASDIPKAVRPGLDVFNEDLRDCVSLCRRVLEACAALRDRGEHLCAALEKDGADSSEWEVQTVRSRLQQGALPYASSDILPVGAYGMAPKWGLAPPVRAFAEANLDLYEEVDRYGTLAMRRACKLAKRAPAQLGPYVLARPQAPATGA